MSTALKNVKHGYIQNQVTHEQIYFAYLTSANDMLISNIVISAIA